MIKFLFYFFLGFLISYLFGFGTTVKDRAEITINITTSSSPGEKETTSQVTITSTAEFEIIQQDGVIRVSLPPQSTQLEIVSNSYRSFASMIEAYLIRFGKLPIASSLLLFSWAPVLLLAAVVSIIVKLLKITGGWVGLVIPTLEEFVVGRIFRRAWYGDDPFQDEDL